MATCSLASSRECKVAGLLLIGGYLYKLKYLMIISDWFDGLINRFVIINQYVRYVCVGVVLIIMTVRLLPFGTIL